jgi:UPF0271 protein
MAPARVDLNADVGEFSSGEPPGQDPLLIQAVTSANIACGVHAGDAFVMRQTIRLARSHGVAIGAHPSLRDREGFGRRELVVSPSEVTELVLSQLRALAEIAAIEGSHLSHIKPHGALYNMAARDRILADAIVRATKEFDSSLVLFGLAGSQLLAAADAAGLASLSEVFADRAYRADGSLLPRLEHGAVIDDPASVVSRALGMVTDGVVAAVDGTHVRLRTDTICVHGDTPGAAQLALQLRAALEDAGVQVAAPSTPARARST